MSQNKNSAQLLTAFISLFFHMQRKHTSPAYLQ